MRALLAACLVLAGLALGGCGDFREPMPVISVVVLAEPGTYLLDGQRLYLTELRSELQKIADKHRRQTTRNARAQVIVSHSAKIPWHRVDEVLGMCAAAGLDKVQTQVREESVPPKH